MEQMMFSAKESGKLGSQEATAAECNAPSKQSCWPHRRSCALASGKRGLSCNY